MLARCSLLLSSPPPTPTEKGMEASRWPPTADASCRGLATVFSRLRAPWRPGGAVAQAAARLPPSWLKVAECEPPAPGCTGRHPEASAGWWGPARRGSRGGDGGFMGPPVLSELARPAHFGNVSPLPSLCFPGKKREEVPRVLFRYSNPRVCVRDGTRVPSAPRCPNCPHCPNRVSSSRWRDVLWCLSHQGSRRRVPVRSWRKGESQKPIQTIAQVDVRRDKRHCPRPQWHVTRSNRRSAPFIPAPFIRAFRGFDQLFLTIYILTPKTMETMSH